MNALIFAERDLTGCTIYNKMATCENCLKYCLQAGIKRFVYRELRVGSYRSGSEGSMNTIDTDEAVIRLLAAMPEVETLNITNGKTYAQDILDSYDRDSEEYRRLVKWV